MAIVQGGTDFATDFNGRHAVSVYADGKFWHQSGGKYGIKPTLAVNTGAYTAGMVVGGELTLTNACPQMIGTEGLGATLEAVRVVDAADQKAGLEILLFDVNPAGTYTDHVAPTFNATDMHTNAIGHISVDPADYRSLGGGWAIATVLKYIPVKPVTGNDLWAVMFTPISTPTYGSTSALSVKFWFS